MATDRHDLSSDAKKLQGICSERAKKKTSRGNSAHIQSRIAARLDPSQPVPESVFIKEMRDCYNWLHHADKETDSDPETWDLREQAERVLTRAIDNMGQLLADYPLRVDDFEDVLSARRERWEASK